MPLPQHTARLVERLLAAYCGRICPPSFERQVVLGYALAESSATVFERRPICGVTGLLRRVDVALFRYEPPGQWRLYCNDSEPTRWRAYPARPHDRSFGALLRELDEDPLGVFWPRVNGASLRWCTSRGRCAGCSARYQAVLGVTADTPAEVIALPR